MKAPARLGVGIRGDSPIPISCEKGLTLYPVLQDLAILCFVHRLTTVEPIEGISLVPSFDESFRITPEKAGLALPRSPVFAL